MAVSLIGESQPVLREMCCSEADFTEYSAGTKEPLGPEFDRLIALIIREQAKSIARNRRVMAQIREKRNKT